MSQKTVLILYLLLFLLVCGIGTASAISITSDVQRLGSENSNLFHYTYSVYNNSVESIYSFKIDFNSSIYRLISSPEAPLDWNTRIGQYKTNSGNPIPGYYQAYTIGAGILPGQTLSGFSVNVSLTQPSTSILTSPHSFIASTSSGNSISGSVSSSVVAPEPSTLTLMSAGFGSLVFLRRIIKPKKTNQNTF
ncbi:MAG: PEP-CTERM sorting domain-containing protein [Nitrospirae bacterium]|nr:PEP-CTERM sorting domain-containing protein [Nitrospirota bacterium]